MSKFIDTIQRIFTIGSTIKKARAYDKKETKTPVILKTDFSGHYVFYSCPNCNETVKQVRTRVESYCEICGQHLDWRAQSEQ